MLKLQTSVEIPAPGFDVGFGHSALMLGSCFADSIGSIMIECGLDVCVNPFGTLYNPASIASAIKRLEEGRPFTEEECVEMGAGAGRICSFSHHTRFARKDCESFLENANRSLGEACAFWKRCDTLILTLGTSMVWRRADNGMAVANCLKRPAAEFTHDRLTPDQVSELLESVIKMSSPRRIILSISPIRHLSSGAHDNSLSKASLLLGANQAVHSYPDTFYFPSYEIVLDELRDYRFYSEDMVHPSELAVKIIWERFVESFIPASEKGRLAENEKAARRAAHRQLSIL